MINKAKFEEDYESFDKLDEYRVSFWKNILRKQHDLVHYGGFSYLDIDKMPLVERDIFMEFTKERKEQEDEFTMTLSGFKRLFS